MKYFQALIPHGVPLHMYLLVEYHECFTTLVALGASFVVVFAAGKRIAEVIIASPSIQSEGLDAQFIRLMSTVLSIVVSVVLFLHSSSTRSAGSLSVWLRR